MGTWRIAATCGASYRRVLLDYRSSINAFANIVFVAAWFRGAAAVVMLNSSDFIEPVSAKT
jgi:hypothetical protein